MKKSIFLLLVVIVLFSCKQETHHDTDDNSHMMNDSTMMHNDSTMTHNDAEMMHENTNMNHTEGMYSCPMHPEVHGNKGDKCSECGMDLTMTDPKESK